MKNDNYLYYRIEDNETYCLIYNEDGKELIIDRSSDLSLIKNYIIILNYLTSEYNYKIKFFLNDYNKLNVNSLISCFVVIINNSIKRQIFIPHELTYPSDTTPTPTPKPYYVDRSNKMIIY